MKGYGLQLKRNLKVNKVKAILYNHSIELGSNLLG